MSRHLLHNEENFWPCVSDMFLALFVIALVLYSTASKKAGEGDIKFQQQTCAECQELLSELKDIFPADTALMSMNVPEMQTKDAKGDAQQQAKEFEQEMASFLCELKDVSSLRPVFPLGEQSQEKFPEARNKYEDAILMLYDASATAGESPRPSEKSITPDAQLRELRVRILSHLRPNGPSAEDLTMKLAEKEAEIKRLTALLRGEADVLQLSSELQKVKQELDALQRKYQAFTKLHQNCDATITSQREQIEQLQQSLNQDTRKLVMEKVRKVLRDKQLLDHVSVEMDAGIIRIPSSTVGFEQKVYKTFSGKKYLALIAQALEEIAGDNHRHQMIDNIVIECHADEVGDEFDNEILSSNRSLYVWKYLNEATGERLQTFKNSKGLGLFSHAGFGERVPVTREKGESSDDYDARCRRIDIRFNCTPQKGAGKP